MSIQANLHGAFHKTVFEEFDVSVAFAAWMGVDTIKTATVVVTLDGVAVPGIVTSVTGVGITTVGFHVEGGIAGNTYLLTIQVEGNSGNKWEAFLGMEVD